MPGLDKTGPNGDGPKTGGQRGICDNVNPNFFNRLRKNIKNNVGDKNRKQRHRHGNK